MKIQSTCFICTFALVTAFLGDQQHVNAQVESQVNGGVPVIVMRGNHGDQDAESLLAMIDQPNVLNAESAIVYSSVITPKQIRALGQLKSLSYISFYDGGTGLEISTEAINEFANLSGVQEIHMIVRCKKGTSWEGLRHLTSLEHFTLWTLSPDQSVVLQQSDMEALASLPNLKTLQLRCKVLCHDTRWFKGWNKLEELDF